MKKYILIMVAAIGLAITNSSAQALIKYDENATPFMVGFDQVEKVGNGIGVTNMVILRVYDNEHNTPGMTNKAENGSTRGILATGCGEAQKGWVRVCGPSRTFTNGGSTMTICEGTDSSVCLDYAVGLTVLR